MSTFTFYFSLVYFLYKIQHQNPTRGGNWWSLRFHSKVFIFTALFLEFIIGVRQSNTVLSNKEGNRESGNYFGKKKIKDLPLTWPEPLMFWKGAKSLSLISLVDKSKGAASSVLPTVRIGCLRKALWSLLYFLESTAGLLCGSSPP